MKPYMAFSRVEGPVEGAILVFSFTAKDARKLAWGWCLNVDDWLDQAVRLIRDDSIFSLADQGKLAANVPHIIDSPISCECCEMWGAGITKDGLCGNCNEFPGDALIRCLNGSAA